MAKYTIKEYNFFGMDSKDYPDQGIDHPDGIPSRL